MLTRDFTVGFELEYSFPSHNVVSGSLATFGRAKYDGTVPQGFELESRICRASDFTIPNYMEQWKNLFSILTGFGVQTECSAGAGHHIHIERRQFTDIQIYALNAFLVSYQPFIKTVGGRDFTTYCQAVMNELSMIQQGMGFRHDDRYRVLNVNRSTTIEYRFFKTTKEFNRFMANMQFAIASSNFALDNSFRKEDCDGGKTYVLADFCKYVLSNKKDYAHLLKFLQEAGLLHTKGARKKTEVRYVITPGMVPEHVKKPMENFLYQVKATCPQFPFVPPHMLLPLLRNVNPRVNLGLFNFLCHTITQAIFRKSSVIEFKL